MKTKQTLTILLTLLLSFGTWSCEKDEEDKWERLPAETQEGKNTIGCLVDGKVWATNYWGNIGNIIVSQKSISAVYYKKKNSLSIHARKKDHSRMSLEVHNLKINQKISLLSAGGYLLEDGHTVMYYSNDTYNHKKYKGTIYITYFDTINKIVSGRFSFNAVKEIREGASYKGVIPINFTEGRFDIKLIIDNLQQ